MNVVRTRFVSTESLAATFGEEFEPFVRRIQPDVFSEPEEVAEAVVYAAQAAPNCCPDLIELRPQNAA